MAGAQDFTADPRNAEALISLNGALVKRADAKVSIFDGGFVVGDGVWEGLRLHKGTLLFLGQHLDRLYDGAARIRLDIGLNREALTAEIERTLAANAMTDGCHLRVMVTRGEKAAPNQDPRNAIGKPTIAIIAEYKLPSAEVMTRGVSLATVSIRCSPASMFDMRLNSHSRLNLITALLEAIDRGADEALMLDPHGNIASCNSTNLFWVKGDVVRTAGPDYCFNGVTRDNVIRLAREAGIALEVGDFAPEDIADADEAFLTGTFGSLTPVCEIDGRPLPRALPGPMTKRLAELYNRAKDQEAGL